MLPSFLEPTETYHLYSPVTEERYQEVEAARDTDNFLNNATEDINQEVEVERVSNNSMNNDTEERNQVVEVWDDSAETSADIDNVMEVSINSQDGNILNILHLDPLLDLLNKKYSPFQSNVGVLNSEGKRIKKIGN